MSAQKLLIITTGGTIDKSYGVGAGVRDLGFHSGPAIVNMLRKIQAAVEFPIVPLLAKDSLDMTDEDRATIAAMCMAVPYERILITHGTDTMKKTTEAIAEKKLNKTIVITGAGQPAAMQGTDADFNAGFALNAALIAPIGIYIAMNAQLYPWEKCEKNPTTGIFMPVK